MTADQVRNASFEVFFDTDVCPLGTPWAVKGSELGEVKGCYASDEAAHAAATAFMELDKTGEASTPRAAARPEVRRAMGTERRSITEMEARQDASGSWTVTGYASTFNDPYKVRDQYGTFTEQILTGAWDRSLQNRGEKIQFLALHDSLPYGSTKAKNLRFAPDAHGLGFEWIPNPKRSDSVNIAEGIAAQEIDEMSVGMRIPDGGDTWDGDSRSISEASLREISVVARGANPNTEIGMRSDELLAEIRKLEGMLQPEQSEQRSDDTEEIRKVIDKARYYNLGP